MKKIALYHLIILIILITACSKQDKVVPKSMDELYKEKGIPVKTSVISSSEFVKSQNYFSEMDGYKSTTIYAGLSERIEKIHANVGSKVNKDDIIVSFPKGSSKSSYYQAKAQLDNLKSAYERMSSLLESGGISQQDVDNAETQYIIAKNNFEAVSSMMLSKAPFDGVVTEMFVKETKHIEVDCPIFTISDLNKLIAIIWVNENDIDFVKPGMQATATWKSHTILGEVQQVGLAMDKSRKAFRTEVIFDNPNIEIKAGVTAEIVLELFKKENVISLPRGLIKNISSHPYVWLNKDNLATQQAVELGLIQNDKVEIVNGLTSNDQLIIEGYDLLEEGSKITVE